MPWGRQAPVGPHVCLPLITPSHKPVRHQELASREPSQGHASICQATTARLSPLCLQGLPKPSSPGVRHGQLNRKMKIEPNWLCAVASLEESSSPFLEAGRPAVEFPRPSSFYPQETRQAFVPRSRPVLIKVWSEDMLYQTLLGAGAGPHSGTEMEPLGSGPWGIENPPGEWKSDPQAAAPFPQGLVLDRYVPQEGREALMPRGKKQNDSLTNGIGVPDLWRRWDSCRAIPAFRLPPHKPADFSVGSASWLSAEAGC